jgi:predicted Fe-Mo cluster-binding NifX family protein
VKIAVASPDFETVGDHAGHAARFVVFEAEAGREPVEVARVDLAEEQTIHNFEGGKHPLDGVNVVIAGSAGQCFVEKMAARGIVTATARGMAVSTAAAAFVMGVIGPLTEAGACGCSGDHDHHH